jgi:hypothetical protein
LAKIHGGTGLNTLTNITTIDGYVIAGSSKSNDGDVLRTRRLGCLDSQVDFGSNVWSKTFGGMVMI